MQQVPQAWARGGEVVNAGSVPRDSIHTCKPAVSFTGACRIVAKGLFIHRDLGVPSSMRGSPSTGRLGLWTVYCIRDDPSSMRGSQPIGE